MKTLTYGVLPTWGEFKRAFATECPRGFFNLGGGALFRPPAWYPELADYDARALYREVKRLATMDYDGPQDDDSPQQLAGDILGILGFEWV